MNKRKWIILLVGIICLSILITSYAQDFRQVNWGMSKDEVIGIEGDNFEEHQIGIQELLGYESNLLGMETGLVYSFIENKLFAAGYMVAETHTNDNNYIDDYNKIKTALTEKYGEPTIDDIDWKNDMYKDDNQRWGFAVSLGHLLYNTQWKMDNTIIDLTLTGNNYDIAVKVIYYSNELYDWSQQKIREASLSNL